MAATKSLTFDLVGEGTLPHVSVTKPSARNEAGVPLLQVRDPNPNPNPNPNPALTLTLTLTAPVPAAAARALRKAAARAAQRGHPARHGAPRVTVRVSYP